MTVRWWTAGARSWQRGHGGRGTAEEHRQLLRARDALQAVVHGSRPASSPAPLLKGVTSHPQLSSAAVTWEIDAPAERRTAVDAVLAWSDLQETMPGPRPRRSLRCPHPLVLPHRRLPHLRHPPRLGRDLLHHPTARTPRARHRPRLLQPAHHRSRPGPVVGRAPTATALARPPASVDGAQLAQHLPEFELGTAARPEAPLEQRCCAFL